MIWGNDQGRSSRTAVCLSLVFPAMLIPFLEQERECVTRCILQMTAKHGSRPSCFYVISTMPIKLEIVSRIQSKMFYNATIPLHPCAFYQFPDQSWSDHLVCKARPSCRPDSRSPITPTTTEISAHQHRPTTTRNPSQRGRGVSQGDSPSFFPPTKSIPSSMALTMKGVVADVCSDISLARLHRASETFCGEKGARSSWLFDDESGEAPVGEVN